MTFAIGYYCEICGTLDWSCGAWCGDCGARTRKMIYEAKKDEDDNHYFELVKDIDIEPPQYLTDKDFEIIL